jgi:hypothetical protein
MNGVQNTREASSPSVQALAVKNVYVNEDGKKVSTRFPFKGAVSRDFLLLDFFLNQFSPSL